MANLLKMSFFKAFTWLNSPGRLDQTNAIPFAASFNMLSEALKLVFLVVGISAGVVVVGFWCGVFVEPGMVNFLNTLGGVFSYVYNSLFSMGALDTLPPNGRLDPGDGTGVPSRAVLDTPSAFSSSFATTATLDRSRKFCKSQALARWCFEWIC